MKTDQVIYGLAPSAELVIIIVGLLLILIAILDSIKIRGTSIGLVNIKLRIVLAIVGVLLLMYGGFSFGLVNPQPQIEQVEVGNILEVQYPVERIQIISPLNGDSVDCRILTKGVYPEAHNQDIWILVKPSDKKFYPQSDHTNTSYKRNGEWQVITRFGGDKGEIYEIIAYETDSLASHFFSSTIQTWKDSLSYPRLEIEDIPSGAIEVDRIVVSLKDNCRGVF